jgi:hypothetical protein
VLETKSFLAPVPAPGSLVKSGVLVLDVVEESFKIWQLNEHLTARCRDAPIDRPTTPRPTVDVLPILPPLLQTLMENLSDGGVPRALNPNLARAVRRPTSRGKRALGVFHCSSAVHRLFR